MTFPRLALLTVAVLGCATPVPPDSDRPRSELDHDGGLSPDLGGPAACGAATLVEPSEYRALTAPLDGTVVLAADFDGDGHEDLLVSGGGTSVLRADGQGGYAREVVAKSSVLSLAPLDVDADGHPDLVVTEPALSGGLHLVSVMTNDGKGHFPRGFPLGTWVEPLAAVAADMDGDGKQDLVVSEWDAVTTSVKVHLLRQAPGFLFEDLPLASIPSEFYFNVALGAGDLDGDGDADLVIGFDNGLFDRGLSIAWNDHGALTVDPTMLVSDAWPILVLDLDRDGHLDIVEARRVWRGLGGHRFEKHLVSDASGPVTAADLDGDGALDLVVRGSTELLVHRQLANLTWKTSRWAAPGTPTFFSAGPIAAAVIDVGEDGKKDVVFSDTATRVEELEAPAFRQPSTRRKPVVIEGRPFTVETAGADLDGDGQTDVVQFNYSDLVILTNRRGTLAQSTVLETRAPSGSQLPEDDFVSAGVVADLDGDHRLDLAAVTKAGWVVTFFNRPGGVWQRGREWSLLGPNPAPGLEAESLAAGDFDADGDVDLVATQHTRELDGADVVAFLWNDSHGQYTVASGTTLPDVRPHSVAAADIDGDGRPEVLVGADRSILTPRVLIYQAKASSLDLRTSIDVDDMSQIQRVFAADLDGDGATDLLVSLWWRGQRVLWNDGHGAFNSPTILNACPSSLVRSAGFGDVNNDGQRDLVMGCDLDSEVGLMLGDGKRGFTPAPPLYADDGPDGLVVADFDGRCGPDVVIANGSLGGELWLFLNGSPR